MPSDDHRPAVAVVIPCYDTSEEYLRECLVSLQAQTFRNWEAVVVEDGAGKTQVESVVRRLNDSRIRFIGHTTNRGMGAARNTACQASQADFVLTLDADDQILPRFLETTIEALETHATANCVLVDFQEFGTSCDLIRVPDPLPPPCPQHPVFTDTGVLMRRSLWDRVGGYTEDPSLRGVEWWDFWIKAVQSGLHVAHVGEPLYLYRRHAGGASVTTSMVDDYRNRAVLYRKHKSFFDAGLNGKCPRCGPKDTIRAFKAQGYVVSSGAALASGKRFRAIRMAVHGFLLSPGTSNTMQQLAQSIVPWGPIRKIRRALKRRPKPKENRN